MRSIRETMRGTLAGRARAAMERELAEQDRLRQTADFAEGIRVRATADTPVRGPVIAAIPDCAPGW